MTISEGNNLLAEFLGFTKLFGNSGYSVSEQYQHLNYDSFYRGDSATLKFNRSWEWLMEVVKKIEKLDYPHSRHTSGIAVGIFGEECWIEYTGYQSGTLFEANLGDKHASVFKCVVDFVQYYNNGYKYIQET